MVGTQAVSSSLGRSGSDDFCATFWQLWEQYRDYLYRCCIKWIGGNPTDAEDALSRAMLKAWEKVQKIGVEIANFKAWLTSLTHNLCVDIYRERSRSVNRVENIDTISEELGLVSFDDTPNSALETDEKKIVIRSAIANLPRRLRETFILHFYQELSYPEIAQQQEISYQNVCKRISQARAILREELRGYFIEDEGADTELSVPPTATESVIGEKSEGNGGVEAIAGETVLSVAVEEVESVEGEKALEVERDVQQSESVAVAATSEGRLYEFDFIGKQIVGAVPRWLPSLGGSQLFHRLRKLVLEVRGEWCCWVELVLREKEPVLLVLNTSFRVSVKFRKKPLTPKIHKLTSGIVL